MILFNLELFPLYNIMLVSFPSSPCTSLLHSSTSPPLLIKSSGTSRSLNKHKWWSLEKGKKKKQNPARLTPQTSLWYSLYNAIGLLMQLELFKKRITPINANTHRMKSPWSTERKNMFRLENISWLAPRAMSVISS